MVDIYILRVDYCLSPWHSSQNSLPW